MCIAIPGQVMAIDGERAEVDVLGSRRRAGTNLYPQVQVGDYVLINAGLIIEIMEAEEALANLALLKELMALDGDALGDDVPTSQAIKGRVP
jgi:hydrogenase expression/formation protein HypC